MTVGYMAYFVAHFDNTETELTPSLPLIQCHNVLHLPIAALALSMVINGRPGIYMAPGLLAVESGCTRTRRLSPPSFARQIYQIRGKKQLVGHAFVPGLESTRWEGLPTVLHSCYAPPHNLHLFLWSGSFWGMSRKCWLTTFVWVLSVRLHLQRQGKT